MALRKEEFGRYRERAEAMDNDRSRQHDGVVLDISRGLHRRIKAEAARKHLTISEYLEELLDEIVPEMAEFIRLGHPPTRESIEKLREFREQLFQENNYQFIGNSVEELREIRKERLQQLMGEDYQDE